MRIYKGFMITGMLVRKGIVMRKIEEKMLDTYLSGKDVKLGNTEIKDNCIYLHGSKIVGVILPDSPCVVGILLLLEAG